MQMDRRKKCFIRLLLLSLLCLLCLMLKSNSVYAAGGGAGSAPSRTAHVEAKKKTQAGWKKQNGKWYFYSSDGRKLTGWQTIRGKRYYLGKDGAKRTEWKSIDGKRYYFGKNGVRRTGWKKIDEKMYYFGKNGVMRTGWKRINGRKYYFGKNGVRSTGWRKIDGKKYYFGNKGVMRSGWRLIEEKWYYFGKGGALRTSQWIGNFYVNSKGEWVSQPSDVVRLNVKNILQRPELPMGCEVTSLTIALNYHGYNVAKGYLSDNYLPKGSSSSTSPDEGFLGNPRSWSSWYCYSAPIVTCANSYLESVGSDQRATDLTGTKFDNLLYLLDDGKPVVIWGTISMGSPRTNGRWYVGGRSYPRYINLHCMVLTGYDKKKDLVYVADPLVGNVSYRLSTTRVRYAQMGSQAVVIR